MTETSTPQATPPALTLTPAQIEAVRRTWALIRTAVVRLAAATVAAWKPIAEVMRLLGGRGARPRRRRSRPRSYRHPEMRTKPHVPIKPSASVVGRRPKRRGSRR